RQSAAPRANAHAAHHPQRSKPRPRRRTRVCPHCAGADHRHGSGATERRHDLERRILGQEGRCCAQPLAQTHWRAEAWRASASRSVPGARLLELGALLLRSVPGKGEYSLMNVFARYGYDVWTMDHDGYGYYGSSGNNSDIASGVEDLKAAVPVVARETGR